MSNIKFSIAGRRQQIIRSVYTTKRSNSVLPIFLHSRLAGAC